MNAKNMIALTITLALNSTREEVLEAIDAIHETFGIDNSGAGVAPETLVTGSGTATAPTGVIAPSLPTNTVDLDSNGLPWDARIHGSTKTKNADGSWRARRGVDAATVKRVEKELHATLAAGGTAAPPAATTVAAPPAPPVATVAAPPAPPAPPTVAAPPAPPTNPAYTNFVNMVAEQTAAGRIDAEWVKASLANFGVANGDIQNLAHAPDLIAQVDAAFRTALGL